MTRFAPRALLALPLAALLLACGESAPARGAARLSGNDFAQLRWIAGDWRGSGTEGTTQAPFFERYVFPDDSTLLVISFPDSTWAAPDDTAHYELRAGRLGNVGSSRWVASRMDSTSVDFVPDTNTRNSFRWAREPGSGRQPGSWKATIAWTDATGASRERRYLMERAPRR